MNQWSNYGQWRHPHAWWEIQLKRWILLKYPDNIRFDPRVENVTEKDIYFEMKKHYGRLVISKTKLIKDLNL